MLPEAEAAAETLAFPTSTFAGNMRLPVHGWFRFPAGFSAQWVRSLVESERALGKDIVLLDPFAGVGTAVLAAEEAAGVTAYGIEAQPFVARVANAKLQWYADANTFSSFADSVLEKAKSLEESTPEYPKLVQKCYPDHVLRDLHALRSSWERLADGSLASGLTWLALTAILRACSPVGTAPWQYVLPRKVKSTALPPYYAFSVQVHNMVSDMLFRQAKGVKPGGILFESDARTCERVESGSITTVITSPPYPNNYDYADATRLEMTFWGEVEGWGGLHEKARKRLIRSCSQHVSIERADLRELLDILRGASFIHELEEICDKLAAERLQHGGKKDYYLMVAAYFADMAQVWKSLRRVCRNGATVCFVVGDSAPYGVYVPVDRWLGEQALAAGFPSYRFEKLRERNVKWHNRKHRVPLQEGRLWVEG